MNNNNESPTPSKGVKSPQECKDEVVRKIGFACWGEFLQIRKDDDWEQVEVFLWEAAELYAFQFKEQTAKLQEEMQGLIEIHHLQDKDLEERFKALEEENKKLREVLEKVKQTLPWNYKQAHAILDSALSENNQQIRK